MISNWMTSGLRHRFSRSEKTDFRPPAATALGPTSPSFFAACSEESPLAELPNWLSSSNSKTVYGVGSEEPVFIEFGLSPPAIHAGSRDYSHPAAASAASLHFVRSAFFGSRSVRPTPSRFGLRGTRSSLLFSLLRRR